MADIQGVGDLYTDPQVNAHLLVMIFNESVSNNLTIVMQVLSVDYRFGDGDLGPRGMALFFKTFRHCDMSDLLGIPIFPLSR